MRPPTALAAALVLSLASCRTSAPATSPADPTAMPDPTAVPDPSAVSDPTARLHDIWALDRLGGTRYAPVDGLEHPTLELDLTELRVMGTDGCNRFTGAIAEAGPETLRFGPLAGTRKLCRAGRDISEAFNRALALTHAYRRDDTGRLVLLDADGAELAALRHVD